MIEEDRSLNIIAIEEQPLSAGSVRYGCVVNVEEVSSRINHIKRLLENNTQVSPRKITGAYVALGGRSLSSHLVETSRTFSVETEISEKTLNELRSQSLTDRSLTKAIYDSVPVSYFVDDKRIEQPVGMLGHQIRARYNLIVSDERNRKNIKMAFDKCGVKVIGGVVKILATDALILTKDHRGLGSAIVDFGAETTTVAVYKDNALRYLATIPMGSRLITKDMAKLLSISEERAEELKCREVSLSSSRHSDQSIPEHTLDDIDRNVINDIALARVSEIITNIAHQIEQSHIKPEELTEGVVLIGRGVRLNGFSELLKSQLNMKVSKPSANVQYHYSYNLNVPVEDALELVALLTTVAKQREIKDCVEAPVVDSPLIDPEPGPRPYTPKKGKSWFNKLIGDNRNLLDILTKGEGDEFEPDDKY